MVDASSGEQRRIPAVRSTLGLAALALKSNETLAVGVVDYIDIVDLTAGLLTHRLEGHSGQLANLSFSCDGRILASISNDGTIRLWSTATWETVAVLATAELQEHSIWYGLAFHPLRPILAAAGAREGDIDLWKLDVDRLLARQPSVATERYTTAKVVLVGDSGVGKTGLGYRLAHGEFKEQSSTHGQEFWVVDELVVERNDGTRCEAVVWDLAGQPDYRLLHVLLLDDADAAVLVFDGSRQESALEAVEFWLRALSHGRANPCPTILVAARCDRGSPAVTESELVDFAVRSGITGGYLMTSAKGGEGLDQLLARLKELIPWSTLTAVVTTATFKAIKDIVLGLKQPDAGQDALLAGAGTLLDVLATSGAAGVSEDELWAAARNLEASGFVKVLRTGAGDRVVLLKPELLNNLAASMVLAARRNERGLGALDEEMIFTGSYRFPELDGLDEDDRRVLLDAAIVLFIERNVCFREVLGERGLLIFPELINEKPGVLADDADREEDATYVIRGNITNIYAALVVLLGYTNVLRRRNQWHNQADYDMDGLVMGFRQVRPRDSELQLTLHYAKAAPNSARRLFQGLVEQFLRRRDISVRLYPRLACTGCGFVLDRSQVITFVDEGRGFTFCPRSGDKLTIPTTAEAIQLGDEERAVVDAQARQADRRSALHVALAQLRAYVAESQRPPRSCFLSYAWGDAAEEQWVERTLTADLEHAGIEVILDRKDARFGDNLARFVSRIAEADTVVVVGTPRYKAKYENKLSATGSVVAAEVDLINLRLLATEERKATVIPVLLSGSPSESFPPLVEGRIAAQFDGGDYFVTVFDLALTILGIDFDEKGVSDLRWHLQPLGK